MILESYNYIHVLALHQHALDLAMAQYDDIDINDELELLKIQYSDILKNNLNLNLIEEIFYEVCDCNLNNTKKHLELLIDGNSDYSNANFYSNTNDIEYELHTDNNVNHLR